MNVGGVCARAYEPSNHQVLMRTGRDRSMAVRGAP